MLKKGPQSLQGKLFIVLFLCRTYYIRSLWVMEYSVKVLWRFAESRNWEKENFLQWGKKTYGGDPEKCDIVQLAQNVCLRLSKDDDAYEVVQQLKAIRNKYVGHAHGGMDETTYKKVVRESQDCYVKLVGETEQETITEITSSKT